MQSSIGIDVDAPPELVYRLARDVSAWARLLPHYSRSSVVSRDASAGTLTCDFVARRPVVPLVGLALPLAWRSRTWHEPATRRLFFHHVAGATRGMDVTWTIEPIGGDLDRCRIDISHDFRPRVPGLARLVDRWFTRAIAARTLATFKQLAESVAPLLPDARA